MSLLELNRRARPFGGYADYQVTPMPIYACEAHKYTLLCVRLPYGREHAALSNYKRTQGRVYVRNNET